MQAFAGGFALPACLLLFISHTSAHNGFPTAIKKLSPDSSEKLFPEHLAFAPLPILSPREAAAAAISFLDSQDDELSQLNGTTRLFRPAFAPHHDESEATMLRRAAEALALLERRQACPSGMNSCEDIGSSNKCCQDGTYCVDVSDTMVGHVACCPDGATCGGGVGECPSDATSCSPDLGGGCCIPGYICQGVGCVPSAIATSSTATASSSSDQDQATTAITATTESSSPDPTTSISTSTSTSTSISTDIVTASGDETATGGAPFRPTISSSPITSDPETSTTDSDTQTGCPTGFYGCLATHGGGCCRTDRDCNTYSCPAPSTTIVSDGQTIVVLATDVPTTSASSTCAGGWFLCGTAAGPVAGCCPSGYDCGTASCFTVEASQTAEVQKEFPKKNSASVETPWLVFRGVAALLALLVLI